MGYFSARNLSKMLSISKVEKGSNIDLFRRRTIIVRYVMLGVCGICALVALLIIISTAAYGGLPFRYTLWYVSVLIFPSYALVVIWFCRTVNLCRDGETNTLSTKKSQDNKIATTELL